MQSRVSAAGHLLYHAFQRGQAFLQICVLLLEVRDLLLLLFDGVDQYDSQPLVPDALDLALVVEGGKERIYIIDFFGNQADVPLAALLPVERDRTESTDDL